MRIKVNGKKYILISFSFSDHKNIRNKRGRAEPKDDKEKKRDGKKKYVQYHDARILPYTGKKDVEEGMVSIEIRVDR